MSGRKRKSVELMLVEGKSHLTKKEIENRRKNENAIKPKDDNTGCPSWIKDKLAKSEYRRISQALKELNLLTNLDVNTLGSYCIAYANYLKATEQLQDQPLLIEMTNKSGYTNVVENPLIRIQLKYSDEMKKHASEMGLTINSRLKLVVPKQDDTPKNKYEEFM
jgi:P27 family predicted phage terminase small subunit